MNVHLCTLPVQICTSNGTEYIVVDPSNLNLTFQEVGFGISRVLDHPKGICENHFVRIMEPKDPRMIHVNAVIQKYTKNIFQICQRLQLTVCGKGIEYLRNFKWTIEHHQQENLDLSGLGLDCLPFIESFRGVRKLNLSRNNDLRIIPPQLEIMPELREIDLRETPHRSLSDELKQMKKRGVVIFYDSVKAKKEDRAQAIW